MKLLAISDTHNDLFHARAVIDKLEDRIDCVIHAGDMVNDARILEQAFPDLKFYYVAGNCDFYFTVESNLTKEALLEFNGVKIFVTHGHFHSVKSGYAKLAESAKKQGAALAICGHTHESFNTVIEGVHIVNPGSIAYPRGKSKLPEYAVIDIDEKGRIEAGIVSLERLP